MQNESLVVVVDDDEPLCRAVERVLTVGGGYRVRTFNTPHRFLAECATMEPACMVVDIKMPEVDGLTMLRSTREAGVQVPAVFITGSRDVNAAVTAMKLGAYDLLEKPLDDVALLDAVNRATLRGAQERSERVSLAELWNLAGTLTAREAQVCALVSSGRLNKQIAAIIKTTEKTVKVHRARVMSKLGVTSVAQLVRAVDRVLDEEAPATILTADHQFMQRPRALEIMASTLQEYSRH